MNKSPEDLFAYRNQPFLDSEDARPLRILSEYLWPLSHFRQQKIQDTIVFFGSARIAEEAAGSQRRCGGGIPGPLGELAQLSCH